MCSVEVLATSEGNACLMAECVFIVLIHAFIMCNNYRMPLCIATVHIRLKTLRKTHNK